MENDLKNARLFAYALEETGSFDVVSDLHRPLNVFGWHKTGKEQVAQAKKKGAVKYNPALPVVSFKLNDEFKKKYPVSPMHDRYQSPTHHGVYIACATSGYQHLASYQRLDCAKLQASTS